MTKSILKLLLLTPLAIALAGLPLSAQAQSMNKTAPEKKEKPKPAVTPFHGKLKAVDKTAKTISVGEMTIQINSETKLSKNEKPAVLDDGVVGENVSGAYKKGEDGKLTATMIRFGVKAEAPPKPAKSKSPKEEATKEM